MDARTQEGRRQPRMCHPEAVCARLPPEAVLPPRSVHLLAVMHATTTQACNHADEPQTLQRR